MKLDFIDLKNLKPSPLNVRKHGEINGDDLIPSIKANGILQPLLVRKNCEGYEIVAGQRRYHAATKIAEEARERGTKVPDTACIPCAIMEDGDDAKAIEASLAENIARLPMDELDQYDAFRALTKQGRGIADIADHFGVTERLVTQRLAIANLYEPILNAYRREEIQPSTIRLLTMASTKKQKEWFKLFKQDEEPPHWQLKSWLFGGDEIPTDNALFELESYTGVITADLFGEDSYFADSALFWEYQSKAIAEIKQELEEDGWQEVTLLDVGAQWQRWDHVERDKDKGGKVFLEVMRDGEVRIHSGLIHRKEAERLEKQAKGDTGQQTDRPELTKSMENYLDLHRHAAVRVELLKDQGTALRLAVAQIIAGSSLWIVYADPQKANTEAIGESLTANKAEAVFAEARQQVTALLGLKATDDDTLVYRNGDWGKAHNLQALFTRLLSLSDEEVMTVLTFVVAETLPAGSQTVERLGSLLSVDMADHWSPDQTFFDLLRDKEAINAMLAEIGGKQVAEGNLTSTAKVQKQIIGNFMTGEGREHKPDWQPRYMQFPMQGYTERQSTIDAVAIGEQLKEQAVTS